MVWDLTHEDIEKIAIGAGILGTGGGGNPYRGMIRAQMQVTSGTVRKRSIISMDEMPDDALVVPMGGMGAPTIGLEKIGRGDEGRTAVTEMAHFLGVEIAATVPIEVGGGNSFAPMIAAAQARPADGRRRRHGPRLSGRLDDLVLLRRSGAVADRHGRFPAPEDHSAEYPRPRSLRAHYAQHLRPGSARVRW